MASKTSSSSSSTLTVVVLVGITCVGLICYNLSSIHARMESTMMDEPGGRRQRLVTTLTHTMKRFVERNVDKDMEKVKDEVKSKLAKDIEKALELESKTALARIEEGLNQQVFNAQMGAQQAPLVLRHNGGMTAALDSRGKPAMAPPTAEDMDEAVEKRVAELMNEEKLNPSLKHGYFISGWVKNPPWPFQKINDRNGKDTGVIGLSAPFIKYFYNSENEKALFWRLKSNGHVMIGISSYEWFPGNATNPFTDRPSQNNPEDKKIYACLDGFIHCFREANQHIPPGVPRAMISQSDFVDPNNNDLRPRGLPKKYAFAYSNLSGDWNDFNRNWTVAKEVIKIAASNGMKALLIGKKKDADKDNGKLKEIQHLIDDGSVQVTDTLGHKELGDAMEQSEFWFIPNQSDASPRVAAEALCRGTPLLMNQHIAGGWKYVNDQTGVFFNGADDFMPALARLRKLRAEGKLRPREWYSENYGPRKASLRLQAFLELTVGKEKLQKARTLIHKW